ncbi:MAG: heavy-metal-associated domain-containing protein [Planctomycetota bacterium]
MRRLATLARPFALTAISCLACCTESGKPEPAVALRYQVDGMHCDGCVQAITDKVTHLDGVTACRVSLQDRRADISVRDETMAPTVQKAIETLGYKVKPIEPARPDTAPTG